MITWYIAEKPYALSKFCFPEGTIDWAPLPLAVFPVFDARNKKVEDIGIVRFCFRFFDMKKVQCAAIVGEYLEKQWNSSVRFGKHV